MNEFIKISTLEEYKKAIQEKCIIMFTTTWCPDCTFIKPFIGSIAKANPEFKYYHIDRDEMMDLCKEIDVLGIPSFIAYNEGKETNRFVSGLRKTKAEIESFVEASK